MTPYPWGVYTPLPGALPTFTLKGWAVKVDDEVVAGQVLGQLVGKTGYEALLAPHDGKVRELLIEAGAEVPAGRMLAVIAPSEDQPPTAKPNNPDACWTLFRAEMKYLQANGWVVYCGTWAPYGDPLDPERRLTHNDALAEQKSRDEYDY